MKIVLKRNNFMQTKNAVILSGANIECVEAEDNNFSNVERAIVVNGQRISIPDDVASEISTALVEASESGSSREDTVEKLSGLATTKAFLSNHGFNAANLAVGVGQLLLALKS
ncbi:hypothetical protein [Agrobacterium sp. M50-1]|uniref:hypothetical protein n=1 Tax=Agrobacterium sp. M50-1 TaxID=3132821 RepID=UPI003CE5BB7A